MSVCNVQDVLDDGRCYAACSDTKTLLGALVSIGCQILTASDPMAQCDVQTVLDEGRCYSCASSEKELLGQLVNLFCQILVNGGGGTGGGGVIAGEGDNYAFTGLPGSQILKLKNLDTGLCNRIDSMGPNGAATVVTDDGSACGPVVPFSGGTSTPTTFSANDPVAAPADPAIINFHYNTSTKVLWIWDPDTLAWEA